MRDHLKSVHSNIPSVKATGGIKPAPESGVDPEVVGLIMGNIEETPPELIQIPLLPSSQQLVSLRLRLLAALVTHSSFQNDC